MPVVNSGMRKIKKFRAGFGKDYHDQQQQFGAHLAQNLRKAKLFLCEAHHHFGNDGGSSSDMSTVMGL